jgi:hypothetical protein
MPYDGVDFGQTVRAVDGQVTQCGGDLAIAENHQRHAGGVLGRVQEAPRNSLG